MPRFAVNHYICPAGYSVEAFLTAARAVGAGAVGLTVRAVDEVGVPDLKTMLAEAGLTVSSLNSAGYFTATDPEERAAQDRRNRALVQAAAALDAGVLCVITGGKAQGEGSLDAARARIAEQLAALAALARREGVRLGLEPIHPAEMLHKGCINTIGDALRLVEGLDGVDLIVDLYHSWWDPDLKALLAREMSHVALIQICNVRARAAGLPLERDTLGSGEIDVGALVRLAAAQGYSGWYEFELFAHHLKGRRVEDVLGDAAATFGTF
ncbi:MAG: sugar phosphate isomerase/epimerase family protein [Alphaproteobacteria bacterium]|nr:sugar phosphate isomerase/epimerase family protein [Alphaproteobacteria bacterium]